MEKNGGCQMTKEMLQAFTLSAGISSMLNGTAGGMNRRAADHDAVVAAKNKKKEKARKKRAKASKLTNRKK